MRSTQELRERFQRNATHRHHALRIQIASCTIPHLHSLQSCPTHQSSHSGPVGRPDNLTPCIWVAYPGPRPLVSNLVGAASGAWSHRQESSVEAAPDGWHCPAAAYATPPRIPPSNPPYSGANMPYRYGYVFDRAGKSTNNPGHLLVRLPSAPTMAPHRLPIAPVLKTMTTHTTFTRGTRRRPCPHANRRKAPHSLLAAGQGFTVPYTALYLGRTRPRQCALALRSKCIEGLVRGCTMCQ